MNTTDCRENKTTPKTNGNSTESVDRGLIVARRSNNNMLPVAIA